MPRPRLVAGRNTSLLVEQIVKYRPAVAVVAGSEELNQLTAALAEFGLDRACWPELGFGSAAMVAAATAPEVNFVVSAIVGIAGFEATYEAVKLGKRIGLANKETLVAGGSLILQAAAASGAELLPIDSEHNGVHQCLRAGRRAEAVKLILTASGGPFRETPAAELENVSAAQALRHPTWQMGQRITINSATLMNKGFEVMEACWLFGFAPKDVEVVVHPQSSVHALVEFNDGSVVAQISATDMRLPIQYAMTYPDRAAAPVARLNWAESRSWQFFRPITNGSRCCRRPTKRSPPEGRPVAR